MPILSRSPRFQVLRRSNRLRSQAAPPDCESCDRYVVPWTSGTTNRGICPECNHFNDEQHRATAIAASGGPQCPCGRNCYGQIGSSCVCPCECPEITDDPLDTDYQSNDEAEDDLVNQLSPTAVEAEQTLSRRYGWQTNVISYQARENAKRIFYESPGHYAIGQMHDIGIPAESSLANTENYIGQSEVASLHRDIEPWELEAVHHVTGTPYSQLARTFPESRAMNLPSQQPLTPSSQPPLMICPHCALPPSEEFMEWLQSGNVRLCRFCEMVQKPQNPADDPDWHEFNPSVRNVLEICHCRCHCNPESYLSPSLDVDPLFTEASSHASSEPLTEQTPTRARLAMALTINTSRNLPNRIQDSDLVSVRLLPSSRSASPTASSPEFDSYRGPPPSAGLESYDGDRHRPLEALQAQASPAGNFRLASLFAGQPEAELNMDRDRPDFQADVTTLWNLPDLRFSDHDDPRQRVLDDVRMAVEDAAIALASEYDEYAAAYANAAVVFGYYGGIRVNHYFIQEAFRIGDEIDRSLMSDEEELEAMEMEMEMEID